MSRTKLKRFLVLFPGALGDFICFLPTLRRLSERASVHVLTRSEYSTLVPETIKVDSLERYEVNRLFVPGAAEEEKVVRFFASYAAVYSWTGHGQPVFARELQRASGANAYVFPFRPDSLRVHQTDYYLSCLGECAAPPCIPTVPLRLEAVGQIDDYWAKQGLRTNTVLALAPGSGSREKNWPAEFYRELAEWWQKTTGSAVIVISGPVEEEHRGYDLLTQRYRVVRDLNLAQLAALLARVDLYIGNDSGVTHLAAAVGAETVGLFGPTDLNRWTPRGKKVTVITQAVECSPCAGSVMKQCSHRKCLTALKPIEVTRRLEKLRKMACLTRHGADIKVTPDFHPRIAKPINVEKRAKAGVELP